MLSLRNSLSKDAFKVRNILDSLFQQQAIFGYFIKKVTRIKKSVDQSIINKYKTNIMYFYYDF